jgi:hypothetical protein
LHHSNEGVFIMAKTNKTNSVPPATASQRKPSGKAAGTPAAVGQEARGAVTRPEPVADVDGAELTLVRQETSEQPK